MADVRQAEKGNLHDIEGQQALQVMMIMGLLLVAEVPVYPQ